MNWRWKAALQFAFSNTPGGERLNYLLQRYLTKSLPSSEVDFLASVSFAKRHIDAISRHCDRTLGKATFYEFGTGWEMTIPLAFYALGVEHQIVIDIRKLLRAALVNNTIEKYQRMVPDPEFLRRPDKRLEGLQQSLQPLLKEYYGIDYRAPCDARRTELKTGSIDYITSTTTLEHIPLQDIESILRECKRILRDDGLMTFLIDYLDHYSYSDKGISSYNYLKYSDTSWALFNSGLHYQNRLRHRDYLALFRTAGFDIVEEQCGEGREADLKTIAGLSLAKRFRSYSLSDLAVRYALIVVRKKGMFAEVDRNEARIYTNESLDAPVGSAAGEGRPRTDVP